jgi:WD40 repeat protein
VAAVATVVANPFPGLRPFEPSESHLFFGRDEQVDELLVRLQGLRFLAVVGTSGCGKSSLIRAGLLPALYRGCLPSSGSRWRVAVSRPGDAPIRNLAASLAGPESLGPLAAGRTVDDLEATLRHSSLGLVQAVVEARLPAKDNVLVVVDQFEEVFSFKKLFDRTRGEEPLAFVKLLLAAVQQSDAPISVVLTMRSDFLGDCAQFGGLPEALNEAQYLVPRLTRDQRRECIEGPVAVGGASIEPRLVQRLLNDVGDNPDHLPVLQHALMRTWDASRPDRQNGKPIDLVHYEAVGGMAGALDRHAEEAFKALGQPDLEIAPKVFRSLTERGRDGRETRRPQRLGTLADAAGVPPPRVRSVVEPFLTQGPFLTMRGDELLVDISHESFIRLWKRLDGWVGEESKAADVYARLVDRAGRWEAAPEVSLYEGPELLEALDWESHTRPTLAWASRYDPRLDLALRFLRASQKSRRRLWVAILGGLAAAFAVLALFATTSAVVAWREWHRAESGRLAALSLVALRTDPERSLRGAIEAAEKAETKASTDALREALAESIVRKEWSVPLGRASAVAFSPDGTRLAAGTAAGDTPGTGGVWDVETGRLLSSVCGHDIEALRFTPDGKHVLLGLHDGGVVLWDPALKDEASAPPATTTLVDGREGGQMWDLDVRPDGRELAIAAGPEGLLRFELSLEPGGGRAPALLKAPFAGDVARPGEAIASVAYSLDGRRLAAASKGTVTIVDTSSGKRVCETRPLEVDILRVGLSGADPGRLVASSFDDVLRSWPVDDCGSEPERFVGHRRLVPDFAFTDDGDYLVSVSHDGSMRLWDPRPQDDQARDDRTQRRVGRYRFNHVAAVRSGPPASRGPQHRTHVATIGVEPEPDDSPTDTLILWNIASRAQADKLKALTGGKATEDPTHARDLLKLARERRSDPPSMKDQRPSCR